jgi:hypothetical protein
MAAPASAAPMAASAISDDVIGRCGDIDGVWIEPVTAQVMITLRDLAMAFPFVRDLYSKPFCVRLWATSAASRSSRQRVLAA